MMKNNNVKKGNTAKKLLPAAGMLALSASMLATSTYAWFTMSREVEVNNIQMIATTPEDVQLSLGKLTDGELNKDTGTLKATSMTASALATVEDPEVDTDWSNTADFGKYYEFGRLIPASSTDGANIFFTPDANGVGKTVKSDAAYIKANGATDGDTTPISYQATAHTFQSTEKTGSTISSPWTGYTKNTGWNTTKDDGYYVDIPVWFRTSSKSDVNLNVTGYVAIGDETANKVATATTNAGVTEKLYKSVRVAILKGDASESTSKLIDLKADNASGTSIVDYYTGRVDTITKGAVKAAGTGASTTTYGEAVTATASVKIDKAAENVNGYGNACKYVIRVWIEGEDPDCWNATAGQDWKIMLKFTNPDGDPVPTP